MGCFTPSTPNPQNVGGDYLGLANQFAQGEPILYGVQRQYQPGFINLATQGVNQAAPDWLNLFGTATGTAAQSQVGANAIQGAGNVLNLSDLGAAAAGAVRGTNPAGTGILDQLTQTASSQLAAGSQLLPQDVNTITQSVRAGWANRGLGGSAPAQLDEALQLYAGGQNALAQRESFAGNVLQAQQADVTNPALALATPTSNATALGLNLQGGAANLAQGAGPTLFPANQAYDMFNTAYNAQAAAQIAGANNQAAILGSALSY